LHPSNAEKETIMSIELENMARDLALKGYVSSTQKRYLKRAKHLIERFGRPASELGQEDLRLYVEELRAPGQSASTLSTALCALLFLYRKTLARPEVVSFISLPRSGVSENLCNLAKPGDLKGVTYGRASYESIEGAAQQPGEV